MRLAPTRLVPFSYFCTCWNVSPSASPSLSWLMPSMMRRMRTRLPTYLSTGLGALVDIANTPWDYPGIPTGSQANTTMRTARLVCQLVDVEVRTFPPGFEPGAKLTIVKYISRYDA